MTEAPKQPTPPSGVAGLLGQLFAFLDAPWKVGAVVVLVIVGGAAWIVYDKREQLLEAWLTPSSVSLNSEAVPAALERLITESGADLVQAWEVDLSANSQRFVAARRKDGERPVIPEPRRLPIIVKTIDLQVLIDVINGTPACVAVTPTAPSPVVQRLAARGMKRGCAVPIPPDPTAFVGVIYMTWLQPPDRNAEDVAIGAAREIASKLVRR